MAVYPAEGFLEVVAAFSQDCYRTADVVDAVPEYGTTEHLKKGYDKSLVLIAGYNIPEAHGSKYGGSPVPAI